MSYDERRGPALLPPVVDVRGTRGLGWRSAHQLLALCTCWCTYYYSKKEKTWISNTWRTSGNMNDRPRPHNESDTPLRAPLARGRPSGGEALSSRLALPCGEGVAAWALVGHLGCAGAAAGRAALVETAA